MNKKSSTMLFCFSPPVMLLTFTTEIILACYTFWRYKLTTVTRLALLLLVFLATFQLSEFMLCGGLGLHGIDWVRFGYTSITLLPPLGLHLSTVLAKKKVPWLIAAGYLSAAVFVYFFVFVTKSLNGNECMPNYEVFHVDATLTNFYGLYYFGWLFISTGLALAWARHTKHARQLRALAAGYAVFIIPTTLANLINPRTTEGVPSIMCGFAVFFALILVAFVLPGATKVKD